MYDTKQLITDTITTKSLIKADYVSTHEAMLARTLERIEIKKTQGLRTADELWIVDHSDVYTLGQASKEEHILQRTNTPIIKTDRGGQVTWHGQGQLVIYYLFDLESLGWGVRHLVSHAEQAIEDVVNDCLIHYPPASTTSSTIQPHYHARARRDAPGVYLYSDLSNTMTQTTHLQDPAEDAIMLGKVASLGFKIKHGFSYHGIALNINCDLSAFNAINPCGYAGMQMLRLADFVAMTSGASKASMDMSLNNGLTYQDITQKLIDNIAQRHAGSLLLRPATSELTP